MKNAVPFLAIRLSNETCAMCSIFLRVFAFVRTTIGRRTMNQPGHK